MINVDDRLQQSFTSSPTDYNDCLQVLHQSNVSPQYHKGGTTDGYLDQTGTK